ncbi:MAG: CHASE2 domain-containing protein [Candidatus Sericytochromatia bacterium]|nr:CHASE2 domain-containing protein [Candidatus Sericytochromatia bacterium]
MRATLLALGLSTLWTCLASLGALEPLERLTVQARYALRPARAARAPVTVVAIDERALAHHGRMPWDRRTFARLLDRLAAQGARVVGLDVAFAEAAGDPAEDRALLTAMHGVPTVLPMFLAYADTGRQATRAVEPLAPLAAAAVALGSVQLSSRPQAEVWELEPYQRVDARWVPAFPVAVAGAYRGQAWSAPATAFPWRAQPTYLNFDSPVGGLAISAADVLAGRVPRSAVADRMVLIGATATGLPDTNFAVADPRRGPVSGVELAAVAIDNMLGDRFLRRLDLPALAGVMGLLALGPGRWLTRGADGPARRTAWLVGALAAWGLLAALAFQASVWLEAIPVVGLLASCFLVGVAAERTDLLRSRNALLVRYGSDLAGEAQRQRERIEGELHDGLQQHLVVIGREVRALLKLGGPPVAEARLRVLAAQTEEAQAEVKRLRGDLLPPALRHGGLAEALPVLALEHGRRSGLDIQVAVGTWEPLAEAREVELYWLVVEALNNAEKHARARVVGIGLDRTAREAVLTVADDGVGFSPPALSRPPQGLAHSGLHRMWLRMRSHHGDLTVASAPGAGTRLRFTLPLEPRRTDA